MIEIKMFEDGLRFLSDDRLDIQDVKIQSRGNLVEYSDLDYYVGKNNWEGSARISYVEIETSDESFMDVRATHNRGKVKIQMAIRGEQEACGLASILREIADKLEGEDDNF